MVGFGCRSPLLRGLVRRGRLARCRLRRRDRSGGSIGRLLGVCGSRLRLRGRLLCGGHRGLCGLQCRLGLTERLLCRGGVGLGFIERLLTCLLSLADGRVGGLCLGQLLLDAGECPLELFDEPCERLRVGDELAFRRVRRRLEDMHAAVPIAGENAAALVVPGDSHPHFGEGAEVVQLLAGRIEDLHATVPPGDGEFAVAGVVEVENLADAAVELLHLATAIHVEQADVVVETARGQDVAIGPPGDGRNLLRDARQHVELAAGFGFPHDEPTAAIAAGQQHAIGAERCSRHPIGVFGRLPDLCVVARGVHAQHLLRASNRDEREVGREVGREECVVLVAQRRDAVAGQNVEQGGFASHATAAAADEQQLAVPREPGDVGLPLGERQRAQRQLRRDVPQHDLLVPRDGGDARPRAHRKGRYRTGSRGHERGVAEIPRGCERPLRLAEAHLHLREGGVRFRFLRLGAGVLQNALFDPPANERQFVLGQLRGVRWHHRFFVVIDDHPQVRRVDIRGEDDVAGAAALEQGRVVIELQPAAAVARVVAGPTASTKDRQHVVFEGDLLRRLFPVGLFGRCRRNDEGREQRERAQNERAIGHGGSKDDRCLKNDGS